MISINLNYAEIVSTLALIVAFLALGWNIASYFLSKFTRIKVSVLFGESGSISGTGTLIFAGAGSLRAPHHFDKPMTFLGVTNVGNRDIVVRSLHGKSKNMEEFQFAIGDLPSTIRPYESFQTIFKVDEEFLKETQTDMSLLVWVSDTKGKKWYLDREGLDELRKTALYILNGEHIKSS